MKQKSIRLVLGAYIFASFSAEPDLSHDRENIILGDILKKEECYLFIDWPGAVDKCSIVTEFDGFKATDPLYGDNLGYYSLDQDLEEKNIAVQTIAYTWLQKYKLDLINRLRCDLFFKDSVSHMPDSITYKKKRVSVDGFGGFAGQISVWDSKTKERDCIIQAGKDILAVGISPDATHVATYNRYGSRLIWDISTKSPVKTIPAESPDPAWDFPEENLKPWLTKEYPTLISLLKLHKRLTHNRAHFCSK